MKRIIAQYSTVYTVHKSHVRTRGDRGGARTTAAAATAMSTEEEEEEVKTLQTTQYPRVKRSSDFGRCTLYRIHLSKQDRYNVNVKPSLDLSYTRQHLQI